MSTYDESLHPRDRGGKYTGKADAAPSGVLEPRAELDEVNGQYQANTAQLQAEVARYLRFGMPETAHRAELEASDQGDYVWVARAFDVQDRPIDTDEDYDRWCNVNDIVQLLGHPDDNRATFAELFTPGDGGVFTWTRQQDTDPAQERAIRERIDSLTTTRRELGQGSQAAAIVAVRRMLPDGAKATLAWGDQPGPDYLSLEAITLADGTVVTWDDADQLEVDWEEIDSAASDIRDVSDPSLRPIDDRGDYFELSQQAG